MEISGETLTFILFAIAQFLAALKWSSIQTTKIAVMEIQIKENKESDIKSEEKISSQLEKISQEIKEDFKALRENQDKNRDCTSKDIEKIYNKVDDNQKELSKRVDGIAQGLVKVETFVGLEK